MGYMKELDIDAQEALELVANMMEASQVPDHAELLEGLEKLGWIPPTTARHIWDKAGKAYGQAAIKGAGRHVTEPLDSILTILDPHHLPEASK